MTRLTPQQSIEKFVSTYTDLYQDICRHSSQERLPLTMWVLGSDFNTITSHQLETKSDNPFTSVKPIIEKTKPIAYVVGGTAVMVKRVVDRKKFESTDVEIDSKFADEALIEEIGNDVLKTSIDDLMKDPEKQETLLIASSALDIPDLEYGKPELFKGKTIDKLTMFLIKREKFGPTNRERVALKMEVDSSVNQIGNSSMINVMGKKFGQ